MLFPLRTDCYPRRQPLMTQALIAANIAIYLAGVIGPHMGKLDLNAMVQWGHFDPRDFKWWQLFTSLFLHNPASMWHLTFNMLALWVFGPPVEGRLGRIGFLGFYFMAGAVANLAHMMVSPNPVIGASGAIAGVTGIFLALFPRSHVICFYVLAAGMIVVSSLWLVALKFVVDVLSQINESTGVRHTRVANMAHIAGYLYGFTMGFALLGAGLVPREECDVFFLFKQWRRRAALRSANRGSVAGAWESASADTGARLAKRRRNNDEMTEAQVRLAQQRAEVHRLAALNDLPAAAAAYRDLLAQNPEAVMSEQRQLEIANHLAKQGDLHTSAAAYEALLRAYPTAHSTNEVRLLLAVLYARQLRNPSRARELIEAVKPRLDDASQLRLADQILSELPA